MQHLNHPLEHLDEQLGHREVKSRPFRLDHLGTLKTATFSPLFLSNVPWAHRKGHDFAFLLGFHLSLCCMTLCQQLNINEAYPVQIKFLDSTRLKHSFPSFVFSVQTSTSWMEWSNKRLDLKASSPSPNRYSSRARSRSTVR